LPDDISLLNYSEAALNEMISVEDINIISKNIEPSAGSKIAEKTNPLLSFVVTRMPDKHVR
jgi:hypothetical protein